MGAPGLAFETWDPGNELILGKPSDPAVHAGLSWKCSLAERKVDDLRFLSSASALTSLLPRLRRLELRPKRRFMHRLLMQ